VSFLLLFLLFLLLVLVLLLFPLSSPRGCSTSQKEDRLSLFSDASCHTPIGTDFTGLSFDEGESVNRFIGIDK
jgi:hypothetical protein